MSEGQELTPKPRIIEFKGEQGRIQQVNLSNLEAVFANIEIHNKEFSLGAMLAKGLISHIKEEEDKSSETAHPFSAEKDKRDVLSETLGIIHTDSFSPIGISFDTASETGIKLMTSDEEIAETKIRFGLQNPDLFLSFLDALDTMDIKGLEHSATKGVVSKIGYDLFLQIYQHYNNFSKDERVPVIAHRLNEIVSRYKKLGIKVQYDGTDRTEDLENYAKYAKQGILGEYIKAKYNGLFAKPEEESESYSILANWRNDIGVDDVQGRWESAISILEKMKKNSKAKELFEEIKTNLSHCIELALKDIDSKDDSWDEENKWVKRKDKKEVFENARINLQII